MLLLTLTVVSLSLPALWRDQNLFFQINLDLAVRGLTGLVLLFNTYVIYQQLVIKRLRQQLGEQIDYMVRLEVRAEQFEKLSVLDPLTGLYNRRSADMRLRAEVERSRRHAHPLTLVMFDLNDFKQINDRYGHPAGDQVLKEFGERLQKAVRVSDVAVRLGGDEFMVILPECQPDQVVHMLARLHNLDVTFRGAKLPVSFSVGWAGFQAGESAERLLERADQALYADKRARKEQAVASA
jgi:diguanylate cyclase (GGDEF)-like protein